jgi:hypothetical protein
MHYFIFETNAEEVPLLSERAFTNNSTMAGKMLMEFNIIRAISITWLLFNNTYNIVKDSSVEQIN